MAPSHLPSHVQLPEPREVLLDDHVVVQKDDPV